jgi:hypothetical protein
MTSRNLSGLFVIPAKAVAMAAIQVRKLSFCLKVLVSSFPRKREPRDFSRLLWPPAFREGDDLRRLRDLITFAFAEVTIPR